MRVTASQISQRGEEQRDASGSRILSAPTSDRRASPRAKRHPAGESFSLIGALKAVACGFLAGTGGTSASSANATSGPSAAQLWCPLPEAPYCSGANPAALRLSQGGPQPPSTWWGRVFSSPRRTLLEQLLAYNPGPGEYRNPLCVDLPNIIDGTWVMKRHGILEFCNINRARSVNMVRQLELLDREHPEFPEFDPILVCARDKIYECRDAFPNKQLPGPVVFAFSHRPEDRMGINGTRVVLVPDCVFWDWVDVGIDDYEITVASMRAKGRQPPERDVAGWVGNPKTNPLRWKLINMTTQVPEDVEAIAMDWRPGVEWSQHLSMTTGGKSLPDQVASWAYLVDVLGNGYSFRVKMFFFSNRPILWQEQPWEEFYYKDLKPFVHYVPIRSDIEDLPEKIAWLKANPEEASSIARNALHFARSRLTRAASQRRWLEAMWEAIDIQRESKGLPAYPHHNLAQ